MSRCFPFPPPGYDTKIHLDDINLLSKEKKKEKKDRKDKDKKKKEGKDKKDREGSKEKDEKRKHRKEKQKNKKDEEKERTHKISYDDKAREARPICANGEKFDATAVQNNGSENNSKFVQELARRIVDEEKASERQTIQKFKVGDGGKISNAERTNRLNGLAETIKDVGKAPTSRNFHKVNQEMDDGQIAIHGINTTRNNGEPSKSKEYERSRKDDDRIVNDTRNSVVTRSVDGFLYEGNAKPLEKRDAGNGMVPKQNRENNGDGSNKFEEHKSTDQYKQKKSKNKDRDEKSRNKEEKAKKMTEPRQEGPQCVEGAPKSNGVVKIKPSGVYAASDMIPSGEGNLGKRKEHERNGFSHVNGNKSNKLQRSIDAPHTTTENGKKFKPLKANNYKTDSKELRVKNGFIEGRQQKVFSLPKARKTDEKGEESAKSSQPDPKYQIQAKKDELLTESDEQDRVLGSKELEVKNGFIVGRQQKVFSLPKARKTDENGEESANQPHPDSKNPLQIISAVKENELLPESDEQERLFGSEELGLKNGFIKGRQQEVYSLPKATETDENGEESAKLSHPDSVYQVQILSVAKENELLPESDEQEQRLGSKELRLKNGFLEGRPQKVSSLPKARKINENGEESAKLPHPDSEYQTKMLSVAKRVNLGPESDEQERLFGLKEPRLKNGFKEGQKQKVFSLHKATETDENRQESAKSPHPVSKNPVQILSAARKDGLFPAPDEQERVFRSKKPRLKNGFIGMPKATETDENSLESAKPPHPDSEYLMQILSIAKEDVTLPESDEQEWLFGSNSSNRSSKKPKLDSLDNNNETLQLVWDKALRIESAEISALPYVVPY